MLEAVKSFCGTRTRLATGPSSELFQSRNYCRTAPLHNLRLSGKASSILVSKSRALQFSSASTRVQGRRRCELYSSTRQVSGYPLKCPIKQKGNAGTVRTGETISDHVSFVIIVSLLGPASGTINIPVRHQTQFLFNYRYPNMVGGCWCSSATITSSTALGTQIDMGQFMIGGLSLSIYLTGRLCLFQTSALLCPAVWPVMLLQTNKTKHGPHTSPPSFSLDCRIWCSS